MSLPSLKTVLICGCICSSTVSFSDQKQIIIIANLDNITQIKQSDLGRIYTIKKRFWVGGQRIKPYVLFKDSLLHKQFVQKKLGMLPFQISRYWNKLTFTGTGSPPVSLNSEAEMIERIQNTPGSIGYISAKNALLINQKELIKELVK